MIDDEFCINNWKTVTRLYNMSVVSGANESLGTPTAISFGIWRDMLFADIVLEIDLIYKQLYMHGCVLSSLDSDAQSVSTVLTKYRLYLVSSIEKNATFTFTRIKTCDIPHQGNVITECHIHFHILFSIVFIETFRQPLGWYMQIYISHVLYLRRHGFWLDCNSQPRLENQTNDIDLIKGKGLQRKYRWQGETILLSSPGMIYWRRRVKTATQFRYIYYTL